MIPCRPPSSRLAFRAVRRAVICSALTTTLLSGVAWGTTLRGHVRGIDGEPVPLARVVLIEVNRGVFSGEDGTYRMDDVSPGAYHLQATRAGLGSAVLEIVAEGETTVVDVVLDLSVHREQIVVTASRGGRGSGEAVQPVHVIDEAELGRKLAATLGETLSSEAGISSTGFGPGASRPVIRGQGEGRIRVLEGGLGVGDASSASPDHAVATDPLSADQVEILRGPATLLYGSAAVGGVVNVIDRRIPQFAPSRPLTGTARLRIGGADEERSGAIELNGGGHALAWHVDALARRTGDLEIPGQAVPGEPASPAGVLVNSETESEGATVGASWIPDRGYVGLALRGLETRYGIPAAPGDERIRIDLSQRRADLRGEFDIDFGLFDRVRFAATGTDYEHRELEGAEVGTIFRTDGRELRAEILHGSGSSRAGILGVQYTARDVEAIGDEAFVPPSETENAAVFVLQEFERGRARFEAGARFESQSVRTSDPALPGREHDGLSASAGMVWRAHERISVGISLAHSARLPSAEDLYSDGPHLATRSFEVGDPGLRRETSRGVDLTVRGRSGRVTGRMTLFLNRYDDYITGSPSGVIRDGLPEFRFEQRDAEFRGFEADGAIHLMNRTGHHVDLRLRADAVRAELRLSGDPLPRIPPSRAGLGVAYRGPRFEATVEGQHVARQDRVAPFETPTAAHTTVSADAGVRVVRGGVVHHVTLRGSNLTNEDVRNHVSRLKEIAPGPGRGITLAYRLDF